MPPARQQTPQPPLYGAYQAPNGAVQYPPQRHPQMSSMPHPHPNQGYYRAPNVAIYQYQQPPRQAQPGMNAQPQRPLTMSPTPQPPAQTPKRGFQQAFGEPNIGVAESQKRPRPQQRVPPQGQQHPSHPLQQGLQQQQ